MRNAPIGPYDKSVMTFTRIKGALLAAGVIAGATVFAAPASADTSGSLADLLSSLDELGISGIGPVDAAELSRSLCPLLADSGQQTADIAAKVSDAVGRPLGPGTGLTGMAISFLCPRAVDNVADSLSNGSSLLPLFG